MDEELLEKAKQFLYQLHYEDTDRESHYVSQAYKSALQEKKEQSAEFKTVIERLPVKDRQSVKKYLQASDQCAYEEIQQAYVQGIIDCLQIVCGLGMMKSSRLVNEFLNHLKC